MRFSHIVTIYFIMGIVVVGTGIVPASQIGVASVFINTTGENVEANSSVIGEEEDESSGWLNTLIGPVKNALNTITGGALVAVWRVISTLLGFYAWPLVTANHIGAPFVVKLFSGLLLMSFTLGVLRVFKGSI